MDKEKILNYLINDCKLTQEAAKDNYYKLKSHDDILEELNEYLETNQWAEYPIIEEGYTAEDLSNEFNLNALEAYNLLILIREDTEQALDAISKGLPNKEIIIEEEIEDDISKFDYIIGLDNIKQKFLDYEKYVDFSIKTKRASGGIKMYYNIIFSGGIGVGKTLACNEIAKILYEKKIVEDKTPIELKYYDMIGESLNETIAKTTEILDKHQNKLIYIVDMEKFNETYGNVSLDIILEKVKEEKNIIIFGLRPEYVHTFLQYDIFNKVFDVFEFENYILEDLVRMYIGKLKENKFEIDNDLYGSIMELIEFYMSQPNFTNGKFIDLLVRLTIINHSKKYKNIKTIVSTDIPCVEQINKFRITS